MKAIVFDDELKFVDDYPKPRLLEGEALVRIHLAGICRTDIEITKGYLGFKGIIGHEFVGVVEKINSSDRRLSGKRVVGGINCGCGGCDFCLKGLKNHCPDRKTLGIVNKDGAMAEYITLPVENLIEAPPDIADEEAVFTEPLAAAFEITRQVHVKPTDKILVIGDGKLGLLISLVLRLINAEITIAGKHEPKLKIVEKHGIEAVNIRELHAEKRYDIVVEAAGAVEGFETAMRLVKPGGTIVLKSTVSEKKEVGLSLLVVNEITVVGSRCGPFKPALAALSAGLINVRPFITGVFGFERAKEAFDKAVDRDSLKVIIDFRNI